MTPATTNREARSGAQDRQAMTTQMISMMQETPPTCLGASGPMMPPHWKVGTSPVLGQTTTITINTA